MCCIERNHSDRLTSTLGFVSIVRIVRIARLTTCPERSEQFTKETNDELLFSEIAEGILESRKASFLPAFGASGEGLLMKVMRRKEGRSAGIDDVFSPCKREFS